MADLITAKLISHLAAAGIAVIDGPSDTPTDAILHVAYTVQEPVTGIDGYHMGGPVRLTDMEGRVVWADEVKSAAFARSASTSFAQNVARKLGTFLSKQK